MIGSDTDLSTNSIRMKIAPMLTILTVVKSVSVISTKSLVAGASPTSIPSASYFFMILDISVHCSLISSVATSYSEDTRSSFQFSLSSEEVASAGRTSSGMSEPVTESSPKAKPIPSSPWISSSMDFTSFELMSEFTSIIDTELMSKFSLSSIFAAFDAYSSGMLSSSL